ncbi:enoyl-CoA hydratase-related protein [Saccharicrinis sp. FJH54]|uniref:enoyl-CoA hydratase-related protein n=1 Tax=Saccharicrinis sp. FJH54 TaxID=3344665 RepID=UPI0035D48183
MRTYQTIEVDKILENQVAHIRLNRIDVHNAMNLQMITELLECFSWIEEDQNFRGVILSGNGGSFCAGADINWMKESGSQDYETSLADSHQLASLFNTIYRFRIPVIAVVHNNIYGGGIGLMAACDVVYAEMDSQFRFSEVRLGITPATIMPYILKKIPVSVAKAKVYTAERFNAFEALRIGIVDEVKKKGEGIEAAITFMREVLKGSPVGVNVSKELINDLSDGVLDDAMINKTCEILVSAKQTEDAYEGMKAFFEKRSPNWKGR